MNSKHESAMNDDRALTADELNDWMAKHWKEVDAVQGHKKGPVMTVKGDQWSDRIDIW